MINTNWWRHSKFYAKKHPLHKFINGVIHFKHEWYGSCIYHFLPFLLFSKCENHVSIGMLSVIFFMKKDHQTFITDKFCLILLSSFKGDF